MTCIVSCFCCSYWSSEKTNAPAKSLSKSSLNVNIGADSNNAEVMSDTPISLSKNGETSAADLQEHFELLQLDVRKKLKIREANGRSETILLDPVAACTPRIELNVTAICMKAVQKSEEDVETAQARLNKFIENNPQFKQKEIL